ncbi:MAG TPA: inositol monophosphatase family protein [Chloroflexota bacterium]
MSINSTIPLAQLADTAVHAARAAGAILLQELSNERRVEFKGAINLVTDADRRSEAAIVSIVRARYPEHQILAEEGSRSDGPSGYRWIIDPLDGTTNYAHRYPHFAVSIAVELDGEIAVGAVYDPVRDELFSAQAGQGAFVNGKPLSVSKTAGLLHGLLCTGFPYDRDQFGPSLRRWDRFIRRAQAVRRDGSAALDICYVAAGRFDGFWENHLQPWDAAAGLLVVREAGGTVSGFDGGVPDLYAGELVASNGLLHGDMLEVLAEVEREAVAGPASG